MFQIVKLNYISVDSSTSRNKRIFFNYGKIILGDFAQ